MRNHDNNLSQAAQAEMNGCEKVNCLTMAELAKTGPEKHLRFWEKIKLRFRGRADGKANLPAKHDGGNLHSPFLNQETKAYSEYEGG